MARHILSGKVLIGNLAGEIRGLARRRREHSPAGAVRDDFLRRIFATVVRAPARRRVRRRLLFSSRRQRPDRPRRENPGGRSARRNQGGRRRSLDARLLRRSGRKAELPELGNADNSDNVAMLGGRTPVFQTMEAREFLSGTLGVENGRFDQL